MALQTWTCTNCDKKFTVGQWECTPGTAHKVAEKTYLLNDAPTDTGTPGAGGMDSLRDGRTRICNIPPDQTVLQNGEAHVIPGGFVEFIRGRFSTSDPVQQYYLERKGGFCTEEQWRAAWLSRDQQHHLREMELRAGEQRLENERNELLAQQKQQRLAPVGR